MTWVIVRNGQIAFRGSRDEVLDAADRYGLICHAVTVRRGDAQVRVQVEGRGWYGDGIEIPPALVRGAVMMPERMLPARLRRRAA